MSLLFQLVTWGDPALVLQRFQRRADALDVGEYWAAETAAKKGKTSIDSIVALVQAERERWDEEKEALEANMEELKDRKLRSAWNREEAARSPDAEKQAETCSAEKDLPSFRRQLRQMQALKREHQELRKVIKARSRFGAWVCERHMKESEDEETDTEKEALRRKISDLFVRLRAVWVTESALQRLLAVASVPVQGFAEGSDPGFSAMSGAEG
ncbi:unnamed protein product [Symbiodinium sp. CCMP2592]|nr:unnamed protein product [Symbiodinium sp. CCMP2592]